MGFFDKPSIANNGNSPCPNCGAPLMPSMTVCPKCHYDLKLGKVPQAELDRLAASKAIDEKDASIAKKTQEAREQAFQAQLELSAEFAEARKNFLSTTGFEFSGYEIVEYLDIKTGISVLGTGLFSETGAAFADMFGSESSGMASKLVQAQISAKERFIIACLKAGANAAIGVKIDIMTLSNNMLVASCTGTAVKLEKAN